MNKKMNKNINKIKNPCFYTKNGPAILALALTELFSSSFHQQAFAQSSPQPEVQTIASEIRMTVHYLNSLVDTTYSDSADQRFDISPDYATAGRAARKVFKEQITDFRKSLVSLINGDFGENLRYYRETAQNKNLSAADQEKTLSRLHTLLVDEAEVVSISYREKIQNLLDLEPSWIPSRIVSLGKKALKKNPEESFAVIFQNGDSVNLHFEMDLAMRKDFGNNYRWVSSERYVSYQAFSERLIRGFQKYPDIEFDTEIADGYFNYTEDDLEKLLPPALHRAIHHQIQKTLNAVCKTAACRSNLFSDYSNFFLQVSNIINQVLPFALDSKDSVYLYPVRFSISNEIPYGNMLEALSSFVFNSEQAR